MSSLSVSSIKPADKVKAWIQQVGKFEPLQGQTNRPSTPNQDPDRHRQFQELQDGSGQETKSVMLSRSRQAGIPNIKSELNREATSIVTLSRVYVPSSPSRTTKRSVPAAGEPSQSTPQTPQTRFRKLKAKGPANTPTDINQEPPGDGNEHEEEDSPLGEPRNLESSPQSEGSRPVYSPPGSPSPLHAQSRQRQPPTSTQFTPVDGDATLSTLKIQAHQEPKPKPQIILIKHESEQEQEQEQEQQPLNQPPSPSPSPPPPKTLSLPQAWSHPQTNELTNWRSKPFRALLPQSGPPCLACHRPSSLRWVSGGNPNGNAHRPFYTCSRCAEFTTWADLRGVRAGNRLCDCGKASREAVTGRGCGRGAGLVYWSCAERGCGFFEWG